MSAERIQALPRIVAACEAPAPAGARHGAQARAAADEINHLLGAVKSDEYAGVNGANLDISPDLLAALIRAAKGERILIGRLLFNPAAIDYRAAARPRTPAHDLEGAAGLEVLRAEAISLTRGGPAPKWRRMDRVELAAFAKGGVSKKIETWLLGPTQALWDGSPVVPVPEPEPHVCTGCIGDGPCEAEPEEPSVSADNVDAADAYDEDRQEGG